MERDFWGLFCQSAKRWPEKEAVVIWTRGEREILNYRTLRESAEEIASALRRHGLKRGQKCLILAETGTWWLRISLAIAEVRGLIIALDPLLSKEEVGYILEKVRPRITLVEVALREKIDEKMAGQVIVIDRERKDLALTGFIWPDELENYGEPEAKATADFTPLVVVYTSGTTGKPKGAVLSQEGFLEITCKAATERLGLTSEEVAVSVAPWHHVMGFFSLAIVFTMGATLVYSRDFKQILYILGKEKGTILLAPPKLFGAICGRIEAGLKEKGRLSQMLYRIAPRIIGQKLRRKYGLEKLRFFVSGSAPMDPTAIKSFRRMGIGFVEGYGMSENCSLSHISFPFKGGPGSVGTLIKGMDQKIMKVGIIEEGRLVALGEEAEPGEYGELWLRGSNIMQGYLGEPDFTRKVLDRDGWFRTGDYAMLDRQGWLWLSGRLDEVMVTPGGKKVSKQEVEVVWAQSPFVEDAVVSMADGKLRASVYPCLAEFYGTALEGEAARQYIGLHSLGIIDRLWEDIERRQKWELAPFKRVPKAGIRLVSRPFVKTSTLKIKRHLI